MPETRTASPVAVHRAPRLLPAARVRRAARQVLAGEGVGAELSITFLGPEAMRRLNRRYLGRNRVTDVIAFSLPGPRGLAGDIYICRAAAQVEARRRRLPLEEELLRLVIHGVLHVLGHDHPEGPGRERSRMWRLQERYLDAVRA